MMAVTIAMTPSARMSIPTARPTSPEHVHDASSPGATCSVVAVSNIVTRFSNQFNVNNINYYI